jgi:hypothetical protein
MPHACMRLPPIRICTHVYAAADAGGGGIGDVRPSASLQPVALLCPCPHAAKRGRLAARLAA